MDRRLQLWLGVSACALLGAVVLPLPTFAGMAGGNGQGNSQDLDPDGGFQHECGEPGGCAEAGESFESRTPDEFGEDEDSHPLATPTRPRSNGGGLSTGDSVRGIISDPGLGGRRGGLGN